MHLLFRLSLIRLVTGWMGESYLARPPTALFGAALLMTAIASHLLQMAIVAHLRADGTLAKTLRRDAPRR